MFMNIVHKDVEYLNIAQAHSFIVSLYPQLKPVKTENKQKWKPSLFQYLCFPFCSLNVLFILSLCIQEDTRQTDFQAYTEIAGDFWVGQLQCFACKFCAFVHLSCRCMLSSHLFFSQNKKDDHSGQVRLVSGQRCQIFNLYNYNAWHG